MTESNEQGVPLPPPPPASQAQWAAPTGSPIGAGGESTKTILPVVLFLILLPGVHRLYVGKIGTGLLFILTFGGIGIWWIYDVIVSVTGNFTDKQGRKITRWT